MKLPIFEQHQSCEQACPFPFYVTLSLKIVILLDIPELFSEDINSACVSHWDSDATWPLLKQRFAYKARSFEIPKYWQHRLKGPLHIFICAMI